MIVFELFLGFLGRYSTHCGFGGLKYGGGGKDCNNQGLEATRGPGFWQTLGGAGFLASDALPRPSNVVPFWVWWFLGLRFLLGLPRRYYIEGSR